MLKELEELMSVFGNYTFAAWGLDVEEEEDVDQLREALLEVLIKHK